MFFLLVLAISNHRLIAVRNIAVAVQNLCQYLGMVVQHAQTECLKVLIFRHADPLHAYPRTQRLM